MSEVSYRRLTLGELKVKGPDATPATAPQEPPAPAANRAAESDFDPLFEADAGRQQERDRTFYYRQLLATIKTFAPLLAAVMQRPGEGASDEEKVTVFTTLCETAENNADQLLELLDIQEEWAKPWIKSQLLLTTVAQVAEQWTADKKVQAPILEAWQRVLEKAPDMEPEEYRADALTAPAALQLSLLKGMAPVMQQIGAFGFFHKDMPALAQRIGDFLMTQALEGADRLTKPGERSRADHLMTVQSLLNSAGRLYAQAWHVEGQQQLTQLASLPKEDPRRKQAVEHVVIKSKADKSKHNQPLASTSQKFERLRRPAG